MIESQKQIEKTMSYWDCNGFNGTHRDYNRFIYWKIIGIIPGSAKLVEPSRLAGTCGRCISIYLSI